MADGFRNYYSKDSSLSPAEMLIERTNMLNLTVPEMTVQVGGLRSLDANSAEVKHRVFTDKPGTLSNDFFVNLLDMSTSRLSGASQPNKRAFTREKTVRAVN